MIVVDASVAYKWFAAEKLHSQALMLLQAQPRLCAPELVMAEICSLAWRNVQRGIISAEQARMIAEKIPSYLPRYYRDHELMARAFELALIFDLSVYDCLYLACIEQADGVLVTTSRHIMKAAIGSPFADRIHHLAVLPANLIAA